MSRERRIVIATSQARRARMKNWALALLAFAFGIVCSYGARLAATAAPFNVHLGGDGPELERCRANGGIVVVGPIDVGGTPTERPTLKCATAPDTLQPVTTANMQ